MNPSPSKIIECVNDSIRSEWQWDADLFFVCSEFPTVPDTFTLRNIFDYCGDDYYHTNFYFCPSMYPPNEGLKGEPFSNLYLALQEAAKQSGYELHINNSDAKRKYLSCTRRRVYREPANGKATGPLKPASWKHWCRNTRGPEGPSGPKRRETRMPVAAEDTCKLKFSISFDAIGFFFRGGKRAMCRHHCGHPAMERHHFPTTIKSITAPDLSIIKDLSAAYAAPAVSANVFTLAVLGHSGVQKILDFIREGFQPHVEHVAFFVRRACNHYDESTNSSAESYFRSLKHDPAAPVKPRTSMADAVDIIAMKADKAALARSRASAQSAASTKLWTVLKIGNDLTDMGTFLLERQWEERLHYISFRVACNRFHVCIDHYTELEDYQDDNLALEWVPKFRRVRVVDIDASSEGRCSCCYYERYGIPCRHLLNVFCKLSESSYEPQLRDVAVRWYKTYNQFAFLTGEKRTAVSAELESLINRGGNGPKLRVGLADFEEEEIPDRFLIQPAATRCWPYVQGECESALSALERFRKDEEDGMLYLSPAGLVSWSYNPTESQDIQSQEIPGDAIAEAGLLAPTVAAKSSRIGRFTRMKTKFTEVMLELEHNDDGMASFEQFLDETLQQSRSENGTRKRPRKEANAVLVSSHVPIETKHKSSNAGRFYK
jgi:SWIM zinc finger